MGGGIKIYERGPQRATPEDKKLTPLDEALQKTLRGQVCSNLYLEMHPTGFIGVNEHPFFPQNPLHAYRCSHTHKDCVAKRGTLIKFLLSIARRTQAAYNGLDVIVAKRCPSRHQEPENTE